MKKIVKRSVIIELLDNMTSENREDILPKLENLLDEEGKNSLIVALDEKRYKDFVLLVEPTKIKGEYKVFFNPFNNCVGSCIKPLKWPYNENKTGIITTYKNLFNTKTNYCSIHSAYNYILHIKDKSIKDKLLDVCFNIDYDIINKLKVNSYPKKENYSNCNIYDDKDIIKYVDYSLIESITYLVNNNIPLLSWYSDEYRAFIDIKETDLSNDNKKIVEELIDLKLAKRSSDSIHIEFIYPNSDITVESISKTLLQIVSLFKYQELTYGIVDVNEYYKNIIFLLNTYQIPYPQINNDRDKIKLCKEANKYLTYKEGSSYYLHPGLREKQQHRLLLNK